MTNAFNRLLRVGDTQRLPPVDRWHPTAIKNIDIHVDREGTWYHDGRRIHRHGIAKIFASILRLEGEAYYLVTPQEKFKITVEDAPFLIIDMESKGAAEQQQLIVKSNMDDVVRVDAKHPLVIGGSADEPRPYVTIRDNLRGLVVRSVYYRIADLATLSSDQACIWSCGTQFVLN